ncbi:MAG: phenylalanine--tRNA ligase subunit beta [Verrucomicrobiota bacterium]|nr:phenylalanine--tRNA ligase subunit beta [Verrucomicrobiota bacterium]
MKIPLSWLKDYVDFDDTVEGLADKLTFSGVEVEGIEQIGGAPAGVVVAEVREVEKHPNADKLNLCRVDFGGGEELTVVCGAPNVEAGGKYPFAPLGTELPGGFKIEKRKVRGVVSEGMLCAPDELGLSGDHSGLLVLDAKWAPGTPLRAILGEPETVLEVEITPNRPDELSLLGIAREVAALYDVPLKMPDISLVESGPPASGATSVVVEDAVDCPRYSARILRNVQVGESPDWMKRRLKAAGIRAINNVVDITNYVMLECGQPLHAFDQKLLDEGRIVVRHPAAGETIVTLDGVERKLEPQMLVICDASKPMAIAGVMGGEFSGIHEGTTDVLLESATFRPAAIRATSRQLGLLSESAYRYMRGVDAQWADLGSRRAARLMCELAGATLYEGAVDVWPTPQAPWTVLCRPSRLEAVLGLSTTPEDIARVFGLLGLRVLSSSAERMEVEIPTFRGDLTREADLIEEYVRIYGLKRLPAVRPLAMVVEGADDKPYQGQTWMRGLLSGLGLQEVMNYSFLAEGLLDLFDKENAPDRVKLTNPLTADHTVLRDALLPQVVENIGTNVSKQVEETAFFEMGRVFRMGADGVPAEEDHLAIGLMGPVGRSGLDKFRPVEALDMFLWMKGLWMQLAAALHVRGASLRPADRPWGEAGRGVEIVLENRLVGWFGLLDPSIAREWRIHQPVGVLEVASAALLKDVDSRRPLAPPPAFPCTRRDVALIVGADVRHEQVVKIARQAAPPELERIELFDIYQGKKVGEGRKSMAYAFTYRSSKGTLTDDEANGFQTEINNALKTRLPADIREG